MTPAHRTEVHPAAVRAVRRGHAKDRLRLVVPRRRGQGPATAHGRGPYSVRRDSLPVAVAAALEAMDAWHPEDFAAAFSASAVLDDGSGRPVRGRAAVRDWCERECVRRRVKLRIVADRTEAATTRVVAYAMPGAPGEPFLAEVRPPFARPGAEHAISLAFTVSCGFITHLRIADLPGDTAA